MKKTVASAAAPVITTCGYSSNKCNNNSHLTTATVTISATQQHPPAISALMKESGPSSVTSGS